MSSPFQFPNIRQGQTINDPGLGGYLASGLAGVLKAMQDQEALERERQEFQSKQEYFKTLKEGNALDNEKKRGELKKEQRTLEAKGGGLAKYQEWVGGGAKQESLGAIIARIKDPETAQDFVNRVTDHRKQEAEAAQAARLAADAEVAQATKDAEIAGKKAQATKAESEAKVQTGTEATQLAQPGVDLNYKKAITQESQARTAQMTAAPSGVLDPQVGNAMMTLWKAGGITRADAAKMYGVTLPAGLDPNEKAPTPGGMGAADKRRNEVATGSAKAADTVINELTNRGVKIGKLTNYVSGTKLGNIALSEDEQQLIQANRQFGQMYALFVTGQAASDPLLREINQTVVPAAGDKPGVLQQKAIMRQVVLQAMQSAYGEGKPASQALLEAVQAAKDMGVPNDAVKFLHKSALDANNAEVRGQKDQSQSPILAPSTNWQPMDYDSVMGAYDFGGKR